MPSALVVSHLHNGIILKAYPPPSVQLSLNLLNRLILGAIIIHLIVFNKFYYFYFITNNQNNEKTYIFIFNSINRCL